AHFTDQAARFPADNAAESFDTGTGRPPSRAYFTDQASADATQAAEHSTRGSNAFANRPNEATQHSVWAFDPLASCLPEGTAQSAEHSTRGSGLLTSRFPEKSSDTCPGFSGG